MQAGERRFTTLDGLRGIAALLIVTRHAPVFFAPLALFLNPSAHGVADAPTPFFESYLAVDFFFVLSGFVLASAYTAKFEQGLDGARFFKLRLVRLYPLYLISIAIAAVPALYAAARSGAGALHFTRAFLPEAIFLPAPPLSLNSPLFPLNGPAWSLFFELIANACFGLLGRRFSKPILLATVAVSALLLAISVLGHQLGFGASGQGAMADGFQWRAFGAGLVRVAYSFSAGVLVYRLWTRAPLKLNIPPLPICIALLAVLSCSPPPAFQAGFDLIMVLFGFPLLVWVAASSTPRLKFEVDMFTALGLGSYAIYVLQKPLYDLSMMVLVIIQGRAVTQVPWYAGCVFLIAVVALALWVTTFVDIPIRRRLAATFTVKRPSLAASSI